MSEQGPDRRRRALLRAGAAITLGSAIPAALRAATAPDPNPHRVLADGLRFPEGPVALPDESVLVVEIARRTLTRVGADGTVDTLARLSGGPNGAAIGPDGACYICNNGGDVFTEIEGVLLPTGPSTDYESGWIERVDLASGKAETLYRHASGQPLSAPNDLVFDASGGFWFTDIGKAGARARRYGAVCYARADGSEARRVVYPAHAPNGIGLSPDGKTLYVAELITGRLIAFDVVAPGKLSGTAGLLPGRLVGAGPGRYLFDSLALESDGNICVAAPIPGEVVRFSPDGRLLETVAMPGPLPTNICFGGPGNRTAYITLSGHGQLIAMEWPGPGLALRHAKR